MDLPEENGAQDMLTEGDIIALWPVTLDTRLVYCKIETVKIQKLVSKHPDKWHLTLDW